MSKKNTGTRMSTWMVDVIIPPTIGAIGFITSDPIPDYSIGVRLRMTAVTSSVWDATAAQLRRS
jgi:hypothetical protein